MEFYFKIYIYIYTALKGHKIIYNVCYYIRFQDYVKYRQNFLSRIYMKLMLKFVNITKCENKQTIIKINYMKDNVNIFYKCNK